MSLQGIVFCCGDLRKFLTRPGRGNVEKELFSTSSSLNFEIMTLILGDISQECWMVAKRASKEIENHGNMIY